MRLAPIVILAVAAALSTASGAAAQSASTGTLVGHITFCRSFPHPVQAPEGGDDTGPQLQDVTPGFNRGIPQPITLPAQDVQLMIQGTAVSARTDANGAFTLAGVPAAQAVTVLAQVPPGPAMVLNNPNLSLQPGQTLDLGTLALSGCANAAPAFVLPPAPAPDTPTPPSPTIQDETQTDEISD
jgi:hypothetical protein